MCVLTHCISNCRKYSKKFPGGYERNYLHNTSTISSLPLEQAQVSLSEPCMGKS